MGMISWRAGTTESNPRAPQANAASPVAATHQLHTIVLLRWVLIIATSYLVLFSRPLSEVTPGVALFVAAYLASNVALTELAPRLRAAGVLDWLVILVDTVALSVALALTQSSSSDFYVLYFAVLFLSALSERIGLVVGAALLVTLTHLYTMSHFLDVNVLLQRGYMLRVPFLFVVALFFSHLVHHARERERTVEHRRAHDLRLDLLSSLSHDLKNALGVIDSLAELLLDGSAGPLNDDQADLTRRIQGSTRQVIALSQNLIDAERVEAGRLVLQRRPTSLTTVIDDALIVAGAASEIKGVALQSHVERGLPAIAIDPVQIERVLANLLGNAIKFTPAGGRVRLTARARGEGVEVAVTDDGPGIPAEELPRLAERHFRGSRSGGVEGSGLGLFIVRAVVEAHGGTLRIASGVGRGTTVTVSLPLGTADEPRVVLHEAATLPVIESARAAQAG
jgi:signal transduction histidine kinase